jgi:hypothetical protein
MIIHSIWWVGEVLIFFSDAGITPVRARWMHNRTCLTVCRWNDALLGVTNMVNDVVEPFTLTISFFEGYIFLYDRSHK